MHPDYPTMRHQYTGTDNYQVVFDHRIKYRDVFNMKALYNLMHDWVCDQGWASREDPSFPETFYLHRWTQSAGEELWIYWRCQKRPNSAPGAGYFRWDLDIDWHVVGLKDFDQIYEGKKFKANYGEVEVKLFARVVSDYNSKWKNDQVAKSIQKLFFKRAYREALLQNKRELYTEVYKLLDAMKVYLKLRAYNPEPELHRFGWNRDMEPL